MVATRISLIFHIDNLARPERFELTAPRFEVLCSLANKRGARYRYYVSHALLQNRKAEAGSIARVPAPEIESLMCDGVDKFQARRVGQQEPVLGLEITPVEQTTGYDVHASEEPLIGIAGDLASATVEERVKQPFGLPLRPILDLRKHVLLKTPRCMPPRFRRPPNVRTAS